VAISNGNDLGGGANHSYDIVLLSKFASDAKKGKFDVQTIRQLVTSLTKTDSKAAAQLIQAVPEVFGTGFIEQALDVSSPSPSPPYIFLKFSPLHIQNTGMWESSYCADGHKSWV
jgi:hypothetical protein